VLELLAMTDLLGILAACALVALVGLGFVAWERYEDKRLARARVQRRRVPRRIPGRPARPIEGRRAA
jgi:hypothetical protein